MTKGGCTFVSHPTSRIICGDFYRSARSIGGARFVLGLTLAAMLALPAIAQSRREIRDVRYWSVGEVTRVAVELSGEFRYRTERLSNPDRVFFDIENAVHSLGEGPQAITVGDHLLKQVRVAETQPGVTRVVLDLEDGVEVEASQLAAPARLMIELRSADGRGTVSSNSSSSLSSNSSPNLASNPLPSVASGPAAQATDAKSNAKMDAKPAPISRPSSATALGTGPKTKPQTAPQTTPQTEPQQAIRADAAPAPTKSPVTPAPLIDTAGMPPPTPAERNSNGDRSITRVLGLKAGTIVLDAGHGGNDPGTHGATGIVEKEITLDITKRLERMIREELNLEVVQTRTDDRYIGLEERSRIANEAKADLFLSIHVNSNPVKSIAGVETYFLNYSASRADLDIATRENATADSTIYDLKEMVEKISLRAKIDESRELATRIQRSLSSMWKAQNSQAKNGGVKRNPYVVLIGAEMPAAYAEIGFISNDRDEELLASPEHRERIARSLLEGIKGYLETLSKTNVALN